MKKVEFEKWAEKMVRAHKKINYDYEFLTWLFGNKKLLNGKNSLESIRRAWVAGRDCGASDPYC